MKKLTWPAMIAALSVIIVGTWGSSVTVSAADAQVRIVTAGAAKAAGIEKSRVVASGNTINIEIVEDESKSSAKTATKKGEVAGISYELIKWAGRSKNSCVQILSKPGLWLQKLTTREPDDSQIEVAIASMKAVIPENSEDDKW